jgi:hypothetical protein
MTTQPRASRLMPSAVIAGFVSRKLNLWPRSASIARCHRRVYAVDVITQTR